MNNESSSESSKNKCWKILFLKKWHPQPTVQGTKYLFFFVGIIFIIFGIVINIFNAKIKEKQIDNYEDLCKGQTQCKIPFTLNEDFTDTVYFFYGLDNFYQNHRRYIKSKSSSQLSGSTISSSDANTFCSPIVHNSDLLPEQQFQFNNKQAALNPNEIAYPCGLIARSFFTDTFALFHADSSPINIDESGIAWPDDKGNKFKMDSAHKERYWINVEDEHFIVWMRTSGLPNFRKLWGIVRQNLPKGDYYIMVNNIYDVSNFKGHKNIILSTSGPFGGKNQFLSIAFIVVGSISVLIAVAFFIKQRTTDNRFGNSRHQD
ncbi:ligand-effect modulator 3 LEM3 family protein (macronuclear) [Tetrahymena thermophila SB210]|uniref:Ligand-effect modulator 3 LEM3 family protein n=1 Tax=Tetrahymena thermophila (strain SB210) TaxID=312017 RepID=I7MMP0_TETTS|nr:ligand-effect modulator 3 LEM3 family protein [Tetrahymena thermophila SB210]EAS06121.1 ligand-effect modulator 3 LEM3 family protein [Tetrahymena thermophila SB210]|eukprot:XP_001026366.1 ligand-effect modulator 3 LEM3 family protein [Tetrahymena thermophila SB210]